MRVVSKAQFEQKAAGDEVCLAWTMNFTDAAMEVLGKEVEVPWILASFLRHQPGAKEMIPVRLSFASSADFVASRGLMTQWEMGSQSRHKKCQR